MLTLRTWRLDILFGALILALLALAARMGVLLRDGRAEALRQEALQERMEIPLPSRTGGIFARANSVPVLLAASRQMPSCFVDLKMLRKDEMGDIAIKLAGILGLEDEGPGSSQRGAIDLQNLFYARGEDRSVWVKHNITREQADAIIEAKLPGVGIEHEWVREYPNADLASTVIGWRRPNGAPGGGVELALQRVLAGKDGRRVMRADARRRAYELLADETKLPTDGGNVYLTIDSNIQRYLQDAIAATVDKHKAKWGVGVVVDPQTGEILAMTSSWLDPRTRRPAVFDPNDMTRSGADRPGESAPAEARSNWAIVAPYEPGSAAKTIFAASAVEAGLLDWETKIFCESGNWYPPRGGHISDHGSTYAWLTLTDVIVFSSNIGMGKVGLMTGNAKLHAFAKAFGFGEPTGTVLPGESRGMMRQLRRWDTYSTPRVPFGQEISVTAMQLAMAYAALANGGELLKPRLIASTTDAAGGVTYASQREVVRRVVRPEVARGAMQAMREVCERGTGKKLAELDQWVAFGKTGTAQIPSSTRGQPGYIPGAFTSTFVGGAPLENPRAICLVSIHWPKTGGHYGSTVAGPCFKEVMTRTLTYLGVPPDKQPDEPGRSVGEPERFTD